MEFPYNLIRVQTHTAEVTINADSEDEADFEIKKMLSDLNSNKDDILTPTWELDSDEYELE